MKILLQCKRGFESDLCAELKSKRSVHVVFNQPESGLVIAEFPDDQPLPHYRDFVFASQISFAAEFVSGLETCDRAQKLAKTIGKSYALLANEPVFKGLQIYTAGDHGPAGIGNFCKRFERPLENRLKNLGFKRVFSKRAAPFVHVVFDSYDRAFVGVGMPRASSSYEQGILRLKMPYAAPSRSVLKLEEGFKTLLSQAERDELLQEGMTAVDLGASPGGWSYCLSQYKLLVTAVDNGAMQDQLLKSGLVNHLREDAFAFVPAKQPVDWMVCDIVEQPQRIAGLVEKWFAKSWCKQALVNFKLPMKQRWPFVKKILASYGGFAKVAASHLYHDRAEVTVFLKR